MPSDSDAGPAITDDAEAAGAEALPPMSCDGAGVGGSGS